MCLDWCYPMLYAGTSSGTLVIINAKSGAVSKEVRTPARARACVCAGEALSHTHTLALPPHFLLASRSKHTMIG